MTDLHVKVWDPFVRLFHWTLVVGFTIAYLSGDDAGTIHEWSGYAVLGLVSARTVWGFIGTRYARFADFVCRPSTVRRYVISLLTGHPQRYLGHNPLGGMMVVALLVMLALVSVTGILALEPSPVSAVAVVATAQANGEDERDDGDGWISEVHEALAEFTLVLVMIHIAGVLIGSLLERENLVAAMITGRKRRDRSVNGARNELAPR